MVTGTSTAAAGPPDSVAPELTSTAAPAPLSVLPTVSEPALTLTVPLPVSAVAPLKATLPL